MSRGDLNTSHVLGVKVGDGNVTVTEGYVQADVVLAGLSFPHKFHSFNTDAFDVIVGRDFSLKCPGLNWLSLKAPYRIRLEKDGKEVEVLLEEAEGHNVKVEVFSLAQVYVEGGLQQLGESLEDSARVHLFAPPHSTAHWHCSRRANSCWGYHWGLLGRQKLLIADPPKRYLKRTLIKVALEGARVMLVLPTFGQASHLRSPSPPQGKSGTQRKLGVPGVRVLDHMGRSSFGLTEENCGEVPGLGRRPAEDPPAPPARNSARHGGAGGTDESDAWTQQLLHKLAVSMVSQGEGASEVKFFILDGLANSVPLDELPESDTKWIMKRCKGHDMQEMYRRLPDRVNDQPLPVPLPTPARDLEDDDDPHPPPLDPDSEDDEDRVSLPCSTLESTVAYMSVEHDSLDYHEMIHELFQEVVEAELPTETEASAELTEEVLTMIGLTSLLEANAQAVPTRGTPISKKDMEEYIDSLLHQQRATQAEERHKMLKEKWKTAYWMEELELEEEDPTELCNVSLMLDSYRYEDILMHLDQAEKAREAPQEKTTLAQRALASNRRWLPRSVHPMQHAFACRDEYGKSNLKASVPFEDQVANLPAEVKQILIKHKEVFGELPKPGTVRKLISMDLELQEQHAHDHIKSRPYPTHKEGVEEIMRQVEECVAAGLCEEYTGTAYPRYCSPAFLVGKPGSTAKRLCVDYRKLNSKVKSRTGSLPFMEATVEAAASVRFKTKMDMRSGFWQVELTERASDLMAFITPNGRVFRWNVMPFGIANAPALFQELMNQVLSMVKRRPKVQELLTRGAVLEVHVDDVLLGTNTEEDHLTLLREFFATCMEQNVRVKLEKSEFMQEVMDYLGFTIGYGWWKPVEDKVRPLADFSIEGVKNKVEGVKRIRQFLGSCNFYRRHLKQFTFSSAILPDLIKKGKPWSWTPEHEAALQELKAKLTDSKLLGVPRPTGEFIFISDSSDVGGGGTLFQWQLLNPRQREHIDEQLRTTGVDKSSGALKHSYGSEHVLVPIGHWNWKWDSTRSNYPTYEQELLSGVLLLASQGRILGTNPIVWLCDQQPAQTFMQTLPPDAKQRLRRWWTFLSQWRLAIFHIPGIKNEMPDFLSRNCFDAMLGQKTEDMAKQAFQRMDEHLDLVVQEVPLELSWKTSDLLKEFKEILTDLAVNQSKLIDGVQWSRTTEGLYREDLKCVPETRLHGLLAWLHKLNGHPGPERTRWFFERHFFTAATQKEVMDKLRDLHTKCPCSLAKENTPTDRGSSWAHPIPSQVNSIVYVDFTEMPAFGGHNFALIITCGLSRFCKVIPLSKKCDGERVLKAFHEEWLQNFGCPKVVHSDRDVRLTSATNWWMAALTGFGVKVQFGTPYHRTKNSLCERQIKAFKAIMRILMSQSKSRNWLRQVPMAVWLLNNQVSSRTGLTPGEMFWGRPGWSLEMPTPDVPANPPVKSWLEEQQLIAKQARELLEHIRARETNRANKWRKEALYQVGDLVLVHHTRFPNWKRSTLSLPWFGPFPVLEVKRGSVVIRASPRFGGLVEVGFPQLKHYALEEDVPAESWEELADDMAVAMDDEEEDPNSDSESEEAPVIEMTPAEMQKQGFFEIQAVVKHQYRQGWRFLTVWKGYPLAEASWLPMSAFVLDNGRLNSVFSDYCAKAGLKDLLSKALAMAQRKAKAS